MTAAKHASSKHASSKHKRKDGARPSGPWPATAPIASPRPPESAKPPKPLRERRPNKCVNSAASPASSCARRPSGRFRPISWPGLIRAHRECLWRGYSDAANVHHRDWRIRHGGGCSCTPEISSPCQTGGLSKLMPLAVARSQLANGRPLTHKLHSPLPFMRSGRCHRPWLWWHCWPHALCQQPREARRGRAKTRRRPIRLACRSITGNLFDSTMTAIVGGASNTLTA
jgi:hypothetical protein